MNNPINLNSPPTSPTSPPISPFSSLSPSNLDLLPPSIMEVPYSNLLLIYSGNEINLDIIMKNWIESHTTDYLKNFTVNKDILCRCYSSHYISRCLSFWKRNDNITNNGWRFSCWYNPLMDTEGEYYFFFWNEKEKVFCNSLFEVIKTEKNYSMFIKMFYKMEYPY